MYIHRDKFFFKKIISNDNYTDILKGAGIAFALKVLGALISLTLLIARTLGVEQSGYYFFIISTLLFLSAISSFGLFNAVLKEASINSDLMSRAITVIVLGCLPYTNLRAYWGRSYDFY